MRINRDQIILSRKKQLQFSYHRANGHVLSYLRNRAIWYYFPRFHILTAFPNHVDLEISSACDLKCPMCYTQTAEFKQLVKKQFMDFALVAMSDLMWYVLPEFENIVRHLDKIMRVGGAFNQPDFL